MRRANLYYTYTLRRRRLMGLFLLVPIVLAAYALNGWRANPVWAWFDTDEGTFAAGDPFGEWIYAVCDGERQQITVLKDGRLSGAEGLASLRTVRFPDWCELPTTDNPDLSDWQARLRNLRALTEATGSSAEEILDAARAMPVSVLYLEPLSDWIREDHSHAAGFLDAVAERPMELDHPNRGIALARRANFSRLIDEALNNVRSRDVSTEKLNAWVRARQIADSERSLLTLANMEGHDNATRATLLGRLEAAPKSARADVYSALATHLVAEAEYAGLLAEQLRLVPSEARSRAVRRLLTETYATTQFAIALLSDSRHRYHHADAQLDEFTAIADKLADEAEAPLLLTRHLREIPGIHRRLAATHLLSLDEAGETDFTLAVLRSLADLHPISRPKVVYAVLQSEQFQDRRVQEASLLAIRLELSGPEKQELLSAMLSHGALDNEMHSRISADFG